MPVQKKTKIVATLGPATSKKEVLRKMIEAGVDVFRINFSHANYDDVTERIKMIRELNEELGSYTSILADLQGPKLRAVSYTHLRAHETVLDLVCRLLL